jgi:hypothetical protein
MNADYYNPYRARFDGPKTHTMYVRICLDPFAITTSWLRNSPVGRSAWRQVFNAVNLSCRSPAVTGTSILGIKYNGGVMLAADTLGM